VAVACTNNGDVSVARTYSLLEKGNMFEKREELLDAVDHSCYQIIHIAKGEHERRPRLRAGVDFESVYKTTVVKIKSSGE